MTRHGARVRCLSVDVWVVSRRMPGSVGARCGCQQRVRARTKGGEGRGNLRASADREVRDTELAKVGNPVAVLVVRRNPLEYRAAFAYPTYSDLGIKGFWPMLVSNHGFVVWRIRSGRSYICLIKIFGADRNAIVVTNFSKAKGADRTVI